MRQLLGLLLLGAAAPLGAEVVPTPGSEDPRLQTLVQPQGERARLVMFPDASLTLIMSAGERVQRVVLSDSSAFRVTVTGDADSVSVAPLRPGAAASMAVETDIGRREYDLETGRGLAAAYVVRLIEAERDFRQNLRPDLAAMAGHYRLKGDRSLRPVKIADDGFKTYIEWDVEQSIPAVLGIGPTGEEEVVAGFMRDGIFTIDRVYPELVFRIDKEKTTATRQAVRQ